MRKRALLPPGGGPLPPAEAGAGGRTGREPGWGEGRRGVTTAVIIQIPNHPLLNFSRRNRAQCRPRPEACRCRNSRCSKPGLVGTSSARMARPDLDPRNTSRCTSRQKARRYRNSRCSSTRPVRNDSVRKARPAPGYRRRTRACSPRRAGHIDCNSHCNSIRQDRRSPDCRLHHRRGRLSTVFQPAHRGHHSSGSSRYPRGRALPRRDFGRRERRCPGNQPHPGWDRTRRWGPRRRRSHRDMARQSTLHRRWDLPERGRLVSRADPNPPVPPSTRQEIPAASWAQRAIESSDRSPCCPYSTPVSVHRLNAPLNAGRAPSVPRIGIQTQRTIGFYVKSIPPAILGGLLAEEGPSEV